jgi:uncharacterized protein (TIGR03437 family)
MYPNVRSLIEINAFVARSAWTRSRILLTLGATLAGFANAQFTQQAKLLGNDVAGLADLGQSVAVSADGSTAIVGGPDDNNMAGAAWVFTRSQGGVWTQQGKKLVGTGAANGLNGAQQGFSVALSGDGNTAIVGGPQDNYPGTGAAWVFTRSSGGVWTQVGPKLVGTGGSNAAQQGFSVALSSDGITAIVGGPGDNNSLGSFVGAAWVFTRSSGGAWSQQGAPLVGTGASQSAQGRSVSLSADGNTAIVGGPCDGSSLCLGLGAAWAFARVGGSWTQMGGKLVGTGAVGGANQGASVALSGDGNTAIVGGENDNASGSLLGYGAAWVYARSGNTWLQQGGKLTGTAANQSAELGGSVALSSNGNTAIVGGKNDNGGAGAAWLYTRSGNAWTQSGNKLVGSNAVGAAYQGTSVALSSDGSTAIVGGPGDNNSFTVGIGAAWVFAGPASATIAPTVTTSAATSITISSATLAGAVNPNGSDTQVWFSYGTNNSLSGALTTPHQDLGSGAAALPFTASIAGLTANTTYYFEAVAQSGSKTVQGSILSFTATSSGRVPTVSTSAATSIAISSATVGGAVNPNGLDTHVWFSYSTNALMTGASTTPQQDAGSGTAASSISANVTGLASNTTYYFQAVAQNSSGTVMGSVLSFTTGNSQIALGGYSDFGPNDAFSNNGWCISGANNTKCGPSATRYIAAAFVPSNTFTVSDITLPLSYNSGTNGAVITLTSNSGGIPGTILESFSISNLPGTASAVTVASQLNPVLQAGQTYWLEVQPLAADTLIIWYTNSLGLGGGITNISQAGWVPLSGYAGQTLPAFSVVNLNITSVGNGASFTQAFAPGMLMSVFGTGLSSGSPEGEYVPLPLVSSSGTSVTINGIPAPLLYVSPTQINLQIPYEVPARTVVLVVKSGGQAASINVPVQGSAPGIFVDSNNQNIVPNESAATGSTIGFYVTGAGLVTPSETTGNVPAAGTTPVPNLAVTMTVGGVPATLAYKGIPSWSVGVLQLNFTVPLSAPLGSQQVVVSIGGVPSKAALLTVTPAQ